MVFNQLEVLEIISEEINDRLATQRGLDDPSDMDEEIKALRDIREKVANESDLSYREYLWLSDMVGTHVEVSMD